MPGAKEKKNNQNKVFFVFLTLCFVIFWKEKEHEIKWVKKWEELGGVGGGDITIKIQCVIFLN